MPIYGNVLKVNRLDAAGFRIIADGTILLNTEIPSSKTFQVNRNPNNKIELDLKNIQYDGMEI